MKRVSVIILLLASTPLWLIANPVLDDKFAGKLTDYRVTRNDRVVVRCDAIRIFSLDATAALFKLKDEIVVYPRLAETTIHYDTPRDAPDGNDPSYLTFSFDANALKPGEDYELRFSGSYKNSATGNDITFSSALLRFTTASNLAVVNNPGQATLRLFSRVGVNVSAGAKLIDKSNNTSLELQSAGDPDDFDAAGNVNVVPAPTALDPRHLTVNGIVDVFGTKPVVKPAKPIGPPSAPKDKEAAAWYFNVLHQGAVGVKPTWIANVKIAPVFGVLPGGYFLVPSLDTDVGQGQVGKTKTNDIINPKIAVTRLVRARAGILETLQFSPAFSYETNRKFDKRNALFDGDIRFYFRNFQNTRGERSQDAFFKARLLNPKILPQDVPKARFGYGIKLFLGAEIGTSLTSNEVKSSDKSSQVIVPKYGIRRLRPRLSTTFEFGKLTASFTFTPRYLFSAESVTREIDTILPSGTTSKTILLSTVSGWRGYGELSLSYAIDPTGHYSINTVYKRGSQQPNFDRTNTVQSGILIRF